MGLSNEERMSGIYFNVHHLTLLGYHITDDSPVDKKLKHELECLWPDVLNHQSNTAHYLLGSSSSHIVTDEVYTPWGIAISNSLQNLASYKKQDNDINMDLLDYFDKYLSIHSLLSCESQHIFSIYTLTENLTYYLRRYDDDFLKEFSILNDRISTIQGICFNIFTHNDEFTRAYLTNRIMHTILFESQYDILNEWCQSTCIHHRIKASIKKEIVSSEELLQAHHHIVSLKNELTDARKNAYRMDCILTIIAMVGYHSYNDQLLKMIGDTLPPQVIIEIQKEFNTYKLEMDTDEISDIGKGELFYENHFDMYII
jgi:hypothetical protein